MLFHTGVTACVKKHALRKVGSAAHSEHWIQGFQVVRDRRHAFVLICIFLKTEVTVDSVARRSPSSCLDLAQREASRVGAAASQSRSVSYMSMQADAAPWWADGEYDDDAAER